MTFPQKLFALNRTASTQKPDLTRNCVSYRLGGGNFAIYGGEEAVTPSFSLPGISLLEQIAISHIAPALPAVKESLQSGIVKIRQYFFAQRKFLRFELSYHAIKDNQNYQALNTNIAQQTMKVADRSCSVAFSIWSRRHKQVNTDSKILVCRNTLIKMATSAWLCLGFGWKTVNGKSWCRLSSKRNISKSRLRFR